MDTTILLFLVQDGAINGAIYALATIALVMVFAVTRVIFVPQGEFVAFAAMTVAALEAGRTPPAAWLLVGLGVLSVGATLFREATSLSLRRLGEIVLIDLVFPAGLLLVTLVLAPMKLGALANCAIVIFLITPMGPMIYRIAFAPLERASVLVLLITAFGVHFSLMGLGLAFYGPEGVGTSPLVSGSFNVGTLVVTGQGVAVLVATLVLLVLFALFFEWSLTGKALRACSSNRLGARLVGIPTALSGQIAFALAAGLGAVSGILAGPLFTIYYDSGFLIGLKAFVAAIFGGLVSVPLAVLAAFGVGLAEAFFSFWASNFKEVLVFTLIIPMLVWLSLRSPAHAEEDE